MSEYNNQPGRRQAPKDPGPWKRYRSWVAGLDRKGLVRYRLCLTLAVIAVLLLAVGLWLRAWIRLPKVPNAPALPGITAPGGSQDLPNVDYEGAQLPDVTRSGRKEGYYTFLVCGQDVVSGATDTMILFTYDTKGQRVEGISLLRDTMINTKASSKRLNTVYARNRGDKSLPAKKRTENGMAALRQEVSKLTGIYPDYYVLVQWEAIGRLVDAIGGVEFEVPFDMDYYDSTPGQDLRIKQKAGLRLLDGQDAMEVIRFRKNSDGTHILGDAGRTQIQRDFLTAVLKKCLTPDIILKLPALVDIFVDNVETDLTVGNILAFAQLAVGMDAENNVKFLSMPFDNTSYKGASLALAREDELLELLNGGLNPYQGEIGSDDLQLMYRKSGGGYGVTNATLADPAVGKAQAPSAPKDEEDEPLREDDLIEENEPPQGEVPDNSEPAVPVPPGNEPQGDGTQGGGSPGNGTPGGEPPSDITTIDPSDIFPPAGGVPVPPDMGPAG